VVEFRRLDAEYAELVKHAVRARLAEALPLGRLGDCPDGCELGIIRRECAKKSRQKPIRQLLAEAHAMVGRLKPCFLMSPLSVAQYLPAEASFDLVVFDEASQIPVWDAIGVIARAKQCVVVGDPKRMPPTNFFQKGETGEEDEEGNEDLESILDECLAAGLYSAYLSWHYRSRHESLISFSNHNYYNDRLCTFPAARTTPRLGVAYRYIENGVYDAKASRTNKAEAEALVDYVFERLADPSWKRRSAGVVTFSMAQKTLIEDIFEERRAANPQFEDFFTDAGEEPFFVKNLENVQGDERDVILFSVGYAKGPDGKFLMNFGPLNRSGGERRLNVAVTRAKEQVVVFASCKGAEIDLNRTQAVGAAHLKAFLEYAERGGSAAADDGEGKLRDRFADEVGAFLKEKGFTVERNVGCSGYRIDLGVKDASRKDSYLAAIECDGESYASALTARDRDELRASVLRSLGWNVVHVWSADWALDRARAEERLMKELDEIKHAPDGMLPQPNFKPEVTFQRRRAASAADVPRTDLDKVSNDDLRAKMAEVERDLGRCDADTLYRETARRFGYKTLSPKARQRLEGVRRY
ncbi:MAG: DNA helicase, partial [Kiritimatiellae bacterium]|nr:DNA helicase [Kiritimatiellia bacterium]